MQGLRGQIGGRVSGRKVHCTCGIAPGEPYLPDDRMAWRHAFNCPHSFARGDQRDLRVTITVSGAQSNFLVRLCRTGMFGGPDPTIASVTEEILRLKLRELELEGWGEE